MEYKRDISIDELIPKRLREFYLFGLDLTDSNGKKMPDENIQNQIDSAIQWLEEKANTRFGKTRVYTPIVDGQIESGMVQGQNFDEIGKRMDWVFNDQKRYGLIQLPINKLISVERIRTVYGDKVVWEVPKPWIRKRLSSIQIVPTIANGLSGMALSQEGMVFNNSILTYQYNSQYPSYWAIDYTYGHESIPRSIGDYIMLTASIYVLEQFATAFSPGIASKSMSVGNISQSTSYTASAEFSLMSAQVKTIHDRLTEKKSGYNLDEIIRKLRGIKMYSV